MRRMSLTVVLLAMAGVSSVSGTAWAQSRAGIGVVFGTEAEAIGFQANGYLGLYELLPGFRLGGDLTAYLPNEESSLDVTTSSMQFEINANAQMLFLTDMMFNPYALAGLNWTLARVSIDGPGFGDSETNGAIGLNLGVGAEYLTGPVALYGEGKYIIIDDFDQFVIGAGVRLVFGTPGEIPGAAPSQARVPEASEPPITDEIPEGSAPAMPKRI